MSTTTYSDATLRRILTGVRTIALVGASANPNRPSHRVMAFLKSKGFRVIPVNPGLAGQDLMGEAVRARVQDIAEAVDMVDVFRTPDQVPPVVADAIAKGGVRVLWMQLGIRNEEAAAAAEAAGMEVVMDRCPAIEMPRLGL